MKSVKYSTRSPALPVSRVSEVSDFLFCSRVRACGLIDLHIWFSEGYGQDRESLTLLIPLTGGCLRTKSDPRVRFGSGALALPPSPDHSCEAH